MAWLSYHLMLPLCKVHARDTVHAAVEPQGRVTALAMATQGGAPHLATQRALLMEPAASFCPAIQGIIMTR